MEPRVRSYFGDLRAITMLDGSRRWRDGASRRRRREDDAIDERTPLYTVTRFIGSTTNIRGIKSRASCDK